MTQYNDDYYSTLRIMINGYRKPNETNEELIDRVVNDSSIFNTLVNAEPFFSNAALLKALLTSPDFIKIV